MATIQKRKSSYLIRVSCGYDTRGKQIIQSMTWKPDGGYDTETNRKGVETSVGSV